MIVIDVETSYGDRSNPFNSSGELICIGYYSSVSNGVLRCEGNWLEELNKITGVHRVLCGANFKFDLHWLKRHGFNTENFSFIDIQTLEYILTSQRETWASLENMGQKYLGEGKIDVIKEEYWNKGIDTTDIPYDILAEYCLKDCELTYKVAQKQLALLPDSKKMLWDLCMQDYKMLAEMEYNGLQFDRDESRRLAKEAQIELDETLEGLMQGIPFKEFNFNSPDQLSALLYGGTVTESRRIPVGHYKSGKKLGEVRYRIEPIEHSFPRRYKPLKGTEAEKGGVWATGEDVLNKLKAGDIVDNILKVRQLSKLIGTYYDGLCDMQDKFGWPKDKVYGQFNTAATGTGRLSSAKPNLQNTAGKAKAVFVSRYDS